MKRRIERFHAGNITPGMEELFLATTSRIRAKRDSSPAMRALLDEQGRLNGPPSVWLLSPGLGQAFEAMVGALRSSTSLSPRSSEIVILLVAGQARSEFELFAHQMAAQALGMTEQEIESLVGDGDVIFDDQEESAVLAATRALLLTRDLDDQQYHAAVQAIGERGVFEIIVLIGVYQALALQLSCFRIVPE